MRLRRITGVNQGQIPNQTREKLLSTCPSGPPLAASCHSFACRQGSSTLTVELMSCWHPEIYSSPFYFAHLTSRGLLAGLAMEDVGGLRQSKPPHWEFPADQLLSGTRGRVAAPLADISFSTCCTLALWHFGAKQKRTWDKDGEGRGRRGCWASIKRLRHRHVSYSDRLGAGYKWLLAGVVPTPPGAMRKLN